MQKEQYTIFNPVLLNHFAEGSQIQSYKFVREPPTIKF